MKARGDSEKNNDYVLVTVWCDIAFFGKMKTIFKDKQQSCYSRVAADKKPKEKKKKQQQRANAGTQDPLTWRRWYASYKLIFCSGLKK